MFVCTIVCFSCFTVQFAFQGSDVTADVHDTGHESHGSDFHVPGRGTDGADGSHLCSGRSWRQRVIIFFGVVFFWVNVVCILSCFLRLFWFWLKLCHFLPKAASGEVR